MPARRDRSPATPVAPSPGLPAPAKPCRCGSRPAPPESLCRQKAISPGHRAVSPPRPGSRASSGSRYEWPRCHQRPECGAGAGWGRHSYPHPPHLDRHPWPGRSALAHDTRAKARLPRPPVRHARSNAILESSFHYQQWSLTCAPGPLHDQAHRFPNRLSPRQHKDQSANEAVAMPSAY